MSKLMWITIIVTYTVFHIMDSHCGKPKPNCNKRIVIQAYNIHYIFNYRLSIYSSHINYPQKKSYSYVNSSFLI